MIHTQLARIIFRSFKPSCFVFDSDQAEGGYGSWCSDEFYNHPGGYCFKFNIDTNGFSAVRGTHLTAYLYLQPGDNDDSLKWPIKCTVYLQMLNQRGDHGHHTVIQTHDFKTKGSQWFTIPLMITCLSGSMNKQPSHPIW